MTTRQMDAVGAGRGGRMSRRRKRHDESSPAFVRAPEGNGYAERFIRMLKENLLRIRTFYTVEEFRLARLAFRAIYDTTWLIQRLDYQTPAQVKQQQLSAVA